MRYPVDNFLTKWYDAQPFGTKTDYGYHEGADINLKTGGDSDLGQPIYAIADGVVSSVHIHTTSNNFGEHIHIKHVGPWGTVWCHYAHCAEILVSEGQSVKEGQLVARVGKTGTVYSHVHWSIKLAPTGVDGIARTLEDLKNWTDPIKFVQNWILTPTMPETIPVKISDFEQLRTKADWYDAHYESYNLLEGKRLEFDQFKQTVSQRLEVLAKNLSTIIDWDAVINASSRFSALDSKNLELQDKLDRKVQTHKETILGYETRLQELSNTIEQMKVDHAKELNRVQQQVNDEIADLQKAKEQYEFTNRIAKWFSSLWGRK